ncbi:hypothetical protein Tco_0309126 [Tanacetum coccineum]
MCLVRECWTGLHEMAMAAFESQYIAVSSKPVFLRIIESHVNGILRHFMLKTFLHRDVDYYPDIYSFKETGEFLPASLQSMHNTSNGFFDVLEFPMTYVLTRMNLLFKHDVQKESRISDSLVIELTLIEDAFRALQQEDFDTTRSSSIDNSSNIRLNSKSSSFDVLRLSCLRNIFLTLGTQYTKGLKLSCSSVIVGHYGTRSELLDQTSILKAFRQSYHEWFSTILFVLTTLYTR